MMGQTSIEVKGKFLGCDSAEYGGKMVNSIVVAQGYKNKFITVPDDKIEKIKEMKEGEEVYIPCVVDNYKDKPGYYLRYDG
jgi:hypothetical protein